VPFVEIDECFTGGCTKLNLAQTVRIKFLTLASPKCGRVAKLAKELHVFGTQFV
jgi:hypothetical protein